jgi:hypothetical protein
VSQTHEIKGVQTVPKHKLNEILGCQECSDNLERVGKKFRRVNADSRGKPYQPWPWITAEEMYDSCNDHLEELLDIDERLASVLVRGDYSILDIGTAQSVRAKRESLDLPDPLKDELFVECVNRICVEMIRGVEEGLETKEKADAYSPYATFKLNSNRGPGMKCAAQDEGNNALRSEFLPGARKSPDGLYFRAFEVNPIVMAVRRSVAGGSVESGVFRNKLRDSFIHNSTTGDVVHLAKHSEPDDGYQGLRVRLINNVPMVSNVPLMVCNAILMEFLTPQMKTIYKTTPHELIDWGLGGIVACTDFSAFEMTITGQLRQHIWERIYSERAKAVAEHIDRLPIVGAYCSIIDDEEKTIYWQIDRYNNKDLAEEFSQLLSGTGDTALIGKVVGLASQIRHLILAMDSSVDEIFKIREDGTSIVSDSCRNTGDDAVINFSKIYEDESKVKALAIAYAKSLEGKDRLFDLTLEDPKKYIGMIFAYETGVDPITAKTISVSNDLVSMFTNKIMPEQTASSPIRGDHHIGLAGSYHAYKDTLTRGQAMDAEEFDEYFTLLLEVIRAPFDIPELLELAKKREAELLENPDASVAQIAANLLGLKSVSELDYLVDKEDALEKLPADIRDQLWLPIPADLCQGASNFLNLKF